MIVANSKLRLEREGDGDANSKLRLEREGDGVGGQCSAVQ